MAHGLPRSQKRLRSGNVSLVQPRRLLENADLWTSIMLAKPGHD